MRIFCLIKHVRDTETRIKVVDEGRIFEGEPKEAAKELVKLLHEEAKVI